MPNTERNPNAECRKGGAGQESGIGSKALKSPTGFGFGFRFSGFFRTSDFGLQIYSKLVRLLTSAATKSIALLAVLAVLLLTACGSRAPRADLIILNGAEPESLDPALFTAQPDGRVIGALFDGLTRYDPKTGDPIPGLAERWEITPDGRTYTFHLRSNLVWSTGEPITAADVVYSWRRLADPVNGAGYSSSLYQVKNAEEIISGKIKDASRLGIQAVDARTVRVELTCPAAFFLDLCAYRPLAVVPRQAIEKYGDQWLMRPPVPVSGPYLLEYWRIHDRIRLRKNPRYWDAANTRSETVDILPVESPTTALNLFISGQADIIWDKGLIPSELLDALRPKPYYHAFDYLGSYFVRMNVTQGPLKDVRVRQALALAVDKRTIVDKITRGGETIATSFTPTSTRNYTPPTGLGFDPARARQLLAAAGYPGGKGLPTLTYLINTSRQHEQIAIELKEMWRRELGVLVEIRQTEFKVYLAEQDKLNYDLCRASWVGDYNDVNTFLDCFLSQNGNNRTGWKNARYDELVHQANLEVNRERRAALMRQAETLLVETEPPIIPLYFYKGITFFDPQRIQGIYFNVIDEHPIAAIWNTRPLARP
ncbi:MAG: peptide ABC transporter substrate-binding protein [Verrucomicrobiota bacterium]